MGGATFIHRVLALLLLDCKTKHNISKKNVFGRYQHLVEKYSDTCVYMTRDCIDS